MLCVLMAHGTHGTASDLSMVVPLNAESEKFCLRCRNIAMRQIIVLRPRALVYNYVDLL